MQRIFCLVIGYCFGLILTAEIVTRHVAGMRPEDIGSKNPGMSNVMRELGFAPGIIVLMGLHLLKRIKSKRYGESE